MDQIKWLQTSLNALGLNPPVPEDGEPNAHTRTAVVWFQGKYGLPLTGLASGDTQRALKSALESPESVSFPKVVGVCVHGLGNDVLGIGAGMDNLAIELNKKSRCRFSVFDHANSPWEVADTNRPVIDTYLSGASEGGAKIVYVGHSLGAGLGIDIANGFSLRGITVSLLVPVDPVQWKSNTSQPGVWAISANVEVAECFRQNAYPGGGQIVKANGNTSTKLENQTLLKYDHIALGSAREVHDWCSQAVDKLVATPSQPEA